jgi:hypothetical protein
MNNVIQAAAIPQRPSCSVASIVDPRDIYAAEDRALCLGIQLGLGPEDSLRLVITVARLSSLLAMSGGKGRLIFRAVRRSGKPCVEISAESDAPAWSALRMQAPARIAELVDELTWDQASSRRLVARKWLPTSNVKPVSACLRKRRKGREGHPGIPPCRSN